MESPFLVVRDPGEGLWPGDLDESAWQVIVDLGSLQKHGSLRGNQLFAKVSLSDLDVGLS